MTRRTWGGSGPVVAVVATLTLAAGATAAVTWQDGPPPALSPSLSSPGLPSRGELLGAAAIAGPVPTSTGLQAAVGLALADPAIAGRLGVSIVDAATGASVYDQGAGVAVLPASTAKIATAAAALTALPPDRRLATRVVTGSVPGEVVLVGGGDTTLAGPGAGADYPASARLSELADQVRVALGPVPVTRVLVDESLYSGERVGPGWKPNYLTDGAVAAVGPLMVEGARVQRGRPRRHADPALAAGRQLATLLSGASAAPVAPVVVERGTAPVGAAPLGEVTSPTVVQLVERMLTRSDNDLAESLARQVALSQGQPASFAGAALALEQVLAPLGVDPAKAVLADGSGLSTSTRISPAAVTGLLARAASGREPRLAPLVAGLPVGGFDGTLAGRFRLGDGAAPGAGSVRAKTGTLDGVSALAGVVRTADGRLLAFDLTADEVPLGANSAAQAALDRLASSLAACGCR